MKQKLFFTLIAASYMIAADAQKQSARVTAYAITAPEKEGNSWTEVKLIDLVTAEVIQPVYQSNTETTPLNARTKKPVQKHDDAGKIPQKRTIVVPAGINAQTGEKIPEHKIEVYATDMLKTDKPFATNSAACAYDQKNERLYYTPMGINQLRYIDLRSNTIYYFEDEPFGVLTGPGDIQNQVTRMTIASDGNGYALTNNGQHLIQFTTNKKAKITDLGALTDDAGNGNISIHGTLGFGGDMVADESGNLYVITANRNVFEVNIESRAAIFKGTIKNLPEGYTVNGAAVEKGSSIIVSSAITTGGYYKFDLGDMQASKVSTAASVFHTADLANAALLSDKKKDIEENKMIVKTKQSNEVLAEKPGKEKIAVYPNPVSTGTVKINFTGYADGEYDLQLLDLSGKMISTRLITLNSKEQVQEYKLPQLIAKGTYLLNVMNSSNRVVNTEKIIVE